MLTVRLFILFYISFAFTRLCGTVLTKNLAHKNPLRNPIFLTLSPSLSQKAIHPSPAEHCAALDPSVFGHPIRRDILHLCVVHHLDSLRQGSANTKTRGEVRGSGIKIRQQKGSGRARLGDGQSPMLYGGGVAFGPKPRDFSTKLPRKVVEMGMRVALSAKLRESCLGIVAKLAWENGKTKHLAQQIDTLGWKKTLIVTGEKVIPLTLKRAINNIPMVKVITSKDLNIYELLKWPRLVLDVQAVRYFEKTLGKSQLEPHVTP